MNAERTEDPPWTVRASVFAGAAAALGASACCAGPLLLVVLGVGGAWGSQLTALEAYQPWFIAATAAFLGYAFYRLYLKSAQCAPGDVCAVSSTRSRQKALFWVVSALAVALVALPLYAPVFY
ncbi:mercury transporter MerT [Ramlibacter sp. RBP-2]|uniref:Mercuric transport protein MerT n=1 Tax=Ramlibacter lithotrophicus TaxID=2606681 RepID=A0A7X6I8J5_9BURK|nr:mercuric transporter MerT family protein [Ramlibacter lithotrophicus]NKE68666.1 mercury transporter MerT [Ramlibacter lithotrophicus]